MGLASQTLRRSSGAEKTARFEARITATQKKLFIKAAELTGRSLTDFVVACVQEMASRTVREHEAMNLTIRDREAFVKALLAPPTPAPRLVTAVDRYRDRQRSGVAN